MSAAVVGDIWGIFWATNYKPHRFQYVTAHPAGAARSSFLGVQGQHHPSHPGVNPVPGSSISWDLRGTQGTALSGAFWVRLGFGAGIPRGLPGLCSSPCWCSSGGSPRLGKGSEGLRFSPWCLERVQRLSPRESGWALLTFTLLLLCSAAHSFPRASIPPPSTPCGEERANAGRGGKLWAMPLLASPWLGFYIQLRAQGGLLGQG